MKEFKDSIIPVHPLNSCRHNYRNISQYFAAKKALLDYGVSKADIGGLYVDQCVSTMRDFCAHASRFTDVLLGLGRFAGIPLSEIERVMGQGMDSVIKGGITDIFKYFGGEENLLNSRAPRMGVDFGLEDIMIYNEFRKSGAIPKRSGLPV